MASMPTFIAFLRAVNVGKRQYPMSELRKVLTDAGFEDVETHIQTGNVRFRTSMRSQAKVRAALEKAMADDRGFEVPVVLFTAADLAEVADDARRFATDHGGRSTGHYVSLLREPATAAGIKDFEARDVDGEYVRIGRRAGHLILSKPYHEAKTGNDVFEKTFGVATNRNLTVITKLVVKWTP
jgi:uncharacterized protein (DUF1697 family)